MSKNRITLYAFPFRSRAERVLWTLKELGLEHELLRLPFMQDGQFNPKILQLNPDAKLPVLVHGDKVMTESLAIMEYLNALENRPQFPNEMYWNN